MILNVLGWIEVCIFARGILQMEFSGKKRNIFWTVFVLAGSEIFYTVCPNENIGFVVGELVGYMLSFLILFRGTLGTRIVKYWFCVFYMNIFYIPIDFIVDISTMGIRDFPFVDVRDEVIDILIILLEVFIAIAISRRKQLITWIQFVPLRYYCLGIICGFCVSGINTLIKYVIEDENEMTRIVIAIIVTIVNIFLYGIGIGFAFVDVWREQYKQENDLKDKYLWMLRVHDEGLVSHMREIRSIKHDMQAHTNALEEYIRKKEWEKAESYLREMKEHLSFQSQRLINVGNELVDAILTDGIQKNGMGIEFE